VSLTYTRLAELTPTVGKKARIHLGRRGRQLIGKLMLKLSNLLLKLALDVIGHPYSVAASEVAQSARSRRTRKTIIRGSRDQEGEIGICEQTG